MIVSRIKDFVKIAHLVIKNVQEKKKPVIWEMLSSEFSFFKSAALFNRNQSNGIILVAEVRDFEYATKIAALSKALADKYKCSVCSYNVYIDKIDNSYMNPDQYLANTITNSMVKDTVWKFYSQFAAKRIHNNSKQYKDQAFIKAQTNIIVASIDPENLNSINTITVEGVRIGDLIYDTYLRSFHEPTIEKIDERLLLAIEWALNIFYNFKQVLAANDIKFLINTYTAYLHFGIVTRLCLAKGIHVYTLGSNSYMLQLITADFPYHPINHTLFDSNKPLTNEQLNEARVNLEARFSGHIDQATSYMRQTAFTNTPMPDGLRELFQLKKKNIVVYTHDFYDSPHINRKLQFADFYQYLKETLEVLNKLEDTTVFIKIHPNGIEGNKEKTLELINQFTNNHFIVLDEKVSNLHIIELRPTLIATARGTVCVEMAYWEIPTVALFDNLFANFGFTHTCYSKEEYFDILSGVKESVINFDREKILSFYYQAYIEQTHKKKDGAYHYLSTCKADSFSNEYVGHLLKGKKMIFSENLVNEFAALI